MDIASKEYEKSFLLEPTKLERLLAVMHERLEDQSDIAPRDRFQVFMKQNRCDELSNLEEVLAIENSNKYKIDRLRIVSAAPSPDRAQSNYEIEVDFGVETVPKSKPTSKNPTKMVTIESRSDSPSWNRQTLSQVEEQVERTWANQTGSWIALFSIVGFVVVFLLLLTPILPQDDQSKSMWLDDATLDRIEKILNENRPLTEAEIREIQTQQLRNVLNFERPKPEPQKSKRVLLFFGVPFLILVAVSVYLALACYPNAVFLWGDEVGRNSALEHRRKILWGIIIAVFLGGIVSKLLSEGVLSWIAAGTLIPFYEALTVFPLAVRLIT